LTILFVSFFYDHLDLIKVTAKSYELLSADFRIYGISSSESSFSDDVIMAETTAEHKMNDINQAANNVTPQNIQANITKKPYIKIHKFWNKDPVNVFISINPHTTKQSSKYIADIQKAIWTWSNLLRIYSGTYDYWNFEIKNDSFSKTQSSIIVKVSSDSLGQICNGSNGGRSYALTIYPQSHDTNAYIDMPTSCLVKGHEQEMSHQGIYSTMLHEFGHALGLGHAYYNDGDLMCGKQGFNGVTNETCKQYSVQSARPSALDIKALFYIYGTDGFNEPNNRLLDARIKQYNNSR
jgi:hypothetical protein